MGESCLDESLLNKSELRILLEKLTLRHRRSHRWWSSPVVKNVELAKLILNEALFMDFVLKKMKNDELIFHPFKKVLIQQETKLREIYVQNWVDKIIQLRIQEIINEELKPFINKNVFSFQKGRGPVHAIQAFLTFAKNCQTEIYVLQLDISKYGDNIDQDLLRASLHNKLALDKNPLMSAHISKTLTFEILDTDGQTIQKPKGIPTGSPLVPLFENLYLLPVDEFIENQKPLFYCRYGDDMVIAYESMSKVETSLPHITAEVNKLQLSIHPDKIKITKLTGIASFEWLGFRITGQKQTTSKDSHVKKLAYDIKKEIHKHFFLLRQIQPAATDLKALSKSLEKLEKKIYNKYANRIFNFFTSDAQTKKIDELRIQETHRALCKNFRIDKKVAWKILRQSKHKSANQVRMHFLRKKQWPKVPLKS
jgi:hypothetical protein